MPDLCPLNVIYPVSISEMGFLSLFLLSSYSTPNRPSHHSFYLPDEMSHSINSPDLSDFAFSAAEIQHYINVTLGLLTEAVDQLKSGGGSEDSVNRGSRVINHGQFVKGWFEDRTAFGSWKMEASQGEDEDILAMMHRAHKELRVDQTHRKPFSAENEQDMQILRAHMAYKWLHTVKSYASQYLPGMEERFDVPRRQLGECCSWPMLMD